MRLDTLMGIESSDIADAVNKTKYALFKNGVYTDRKTGPWCLQGYDHTVMREIYNVLIEVNDPTKIWHNKISRGLLVETLDILLGLNPGNVGRVWKFYNNWRGKSGKYPYTYGERIFGGKVKQWARCVDMLRADPSTRQANIVIRRPSDVLRSYTPCSIDIQFYTDNNSCLNATYMMRSNDIALGGLARNIFIGCILLTQMSLATGLQLGKYTHFAVNLHHYTNKPEDRYSTDDIGLKGGPAQTPEYLDAQKAKYMGEMLKSFFSGYKLNRKDIQKNLGPYWSYWADRIIRNK